MSYLSGARATLFGQWAKFGAQLVGFVLLARLLTPADFGVFALAATVFAFATLLADLGLSWAAIREPTLSIAERSGLFWANLAAGSVATMLMAASGPLLSIIFVDSRLTPVALALGLPLLLTGATVQFRVELIRSGRFGSLAHQDAAAAVVGLVGAGVAAAAGLGYWSLVIQSVVTALVVLVMAAATSGWWPAAPRTVRSARRFIRFGGDNLALQSANLLSRTVDVVAVGRVLGAEAVGVYTRSTQLISLLFQQLVTPLTRVVLPRLSATTGDELRVLSHRLQWVTSTALLAALSLLGGAASPLTLLFLGERWSETIAVTQILCVAAMIQSVGYVYYWIFLSRGMTRQLVIAELPARTLMIFGFFVAAPQGLLWTASVWIVGQLAVLASTLRAARHSAEVPDGILGCALRPLLTFTACGSIAVGTAAATASWGAALSLGATVFCWTVAAAALVASSSDLRRTVGEGLSLLRGAR